MQAGGYERVCPRGQPSTSKISQLVRTASLTKAFLELQRARRLFAVGAMFDSSFVLFQVYYYLKALIYRHLIILILHTHAIDECKLLCGACHQG